MEPFLEQQEQQPEQELPRVMAAPPECAHPRTLQPRAPYRHRRKRRQVVRPRQCVQAPRHEARPCARQQLPGGRNSEGFFYVYERCEEAEARDPGGADENRRCAVCGERLAAPEDEERAESG